MRRISWIVGAAICGSTAVGLVVLATFDLPTADRAGSVVGAVVTLFGTLFSIVQAGESKTSATPVVRRVIKVRATGRRSIAAGGDVAENAIGGGAVVITRGSDRSGQASGGTDIDVRTQGPGSIGAGGDIIGNALGGDTDT
jgi:hypothetical protein